MGQGPSYPWGLSLAAPETEFSDGGDLLGLSCCGGGAWGPLSFLEHLCRFLDCVLMLSPQIGHRKLSNLSLRGLRAPTGAT